MLQQEGKGHVSFLGLEDVQRVNVTFTISSFLSTEKGSAVQECSRIRQMQCATALIKFCGSWTQELRADLAGTVPKAANCSLAAFSSFALFYERFSWVTEKPMQIGVMQIALGFTRDMGLP